MIIKAKCRKECKEPLRIGKRFLVRSDRTGKDRCEFRMNAHLAKPIDIKEVSRILDRCLVRK